METESAFGVAVAGEEVVDADWDNVIFFGGSGYWRRVSEEVFVCVNG